MGLYESYIVFDLETTGLSAAAGHRVIEIGAVALENGRPAAEFHSLIHCERRISWGARRVNGISAGMLRGQPPAAEVIPRFAEFIGDHPLVAHNAPFDLSFLRAEFSRCALSIANPHHCTLGFSRRYFPGLPSYKLENLARHFLGPAIVNRSTLHRAIDDARLTAALWLKIME